ncbi:MAG: D-aminoacylase [Acidobacteria bacterium]|nr:D-aminoacylase [Acidobacteriota bacterium]MBI3281366.1 D-aminoacylase [Acidobacteriota bacterium]
MRTLLAGGTVIDGTGVEGFAGDVLIDRDRIARVGRLEAPADALRIDCTGLTVAPGFIDAHSHSDLQVLEPRHEKVRQGVTTEITGNCGFSAFPASDHRGELHEFANGIFCGAGDWGWTTARDYLAVARRSEHVNAYPLAGHGSLRIAVAGLLQGPLAARDLERMEGMLGDCLAQGAAGFSTGLMYAPGSSAPFAELERLCAVTAKHGKVYATHMRSYFSGILDAVDEQLALARRTGCRLQISHLLLAGRRNWDLQPRVLEKIERARLEGIDVAFDCYPYVAGSTVLTQILPQWALEGGVEALLARLADPAARRGIARETVENLAWSWEDIFISAGPADAVGKTISQIAGARACQPVDAVLDLIAEQRGEVNMLSFNQSEQNLRQTLAHPLSIIISDGFYVRGRPHPRLFGTFPRFLGDYVRESGLLPLPEAIRKITDAPACRFGLRGRGRLVEGGFADITVFDADRIGSPATYEVPELPPRGVHLVFVNGRLVYEQA